jgi:predicted O-methyltransferase YrrM
MLKSTLLTVRNVVFDAPYWAWSQRELRDRRAGIRSTQDAVNLVFQYQGHGFYRIMKPNQDNAEIAQLVDRVKAIQPHVIVEIGTRGGGTLFLWSQVSNALEHLISIDLPFGIHGGGYPPQRGKLYKAFMETCPTAKLSLLRRDSQTEATKAALSELLGGQPIDFLFIDGDHRYAGVKKDYALYAELVRPGGLIAFHDIRPNTFDPTIQVNQLWDELKQMGQYEEIVTEPYGGRYGIGVLTR